MFRKCLGCAKRAMRSWVGLAAVWMCLGPGGGELLAQEEKFPPELVRFVPYRHNPVFKAAGPGHWDQAIRERGWILRVGNTYHLWYTGYDGTRQGLKKLGYATSRDGIHWQRHPRNPLYDKHWVEDMMVVRYRGVFYMFAEGLHDRAHWLVSPDGVHWRRKGKLNIRMTNGRPIAEGPYGTPTVWHENDTWYLFYERRDRGIWLAKSRDLRTWIHVQDDPVMVPGPAPHEARLIALNQIIKYRDRYYALYHGRGDQPYWSTNIATSRDLVHWEKYPGNPLLPARENKSSGILVYVGKGFRLYTMHPAVHLHFSAVPARDAPVP